MLFGKLGKKVGVRAPTQKHTPGAAQKYFESNSYQP
jgi:hypothetical protein